MINISEEKIVRAYFTRGDQARCKAVYRTDRGRVCVIEGLDLPPAYQVHWHTQLMGNGAIPEWGSADGVVIPDNLIDTGKTVYGWIYISDESAGVTIKSIVIPVQERPTADGVTPDPQEASIIEQAIDALNTGVETVEGIAEAMPGEIRDALAEAKASGEFDGTDGISPVAGVTKDGNVSTFTVIDENGTSTVQILDGEKGDPGDPGDPGFSPVATVTKSGDTVTITITDAQGTTSATLTEQDALHLIADDYSESAYYPQNAIVVHDGGLYLRIESTVGHGAWVAADWMESNMSDILAAREDAIYNAIGRMAARLLPQGGTAGQVLTKASGTDYDATWTTPQGGGVSDVQVNGQSVVSGGVANVPIASNNGPGVVKVTGLTYGVGMSGTLLMIANATDAQVKAGTNYLRPITPSNQHTSFFYGLAKAAGSDEKNSTLPVGQYTESAKSAIHTMLSGSVSVTGTTPVIAALPGIRYICGEVATLDITLPASGCVDVTFVSGSTPTVLTVTPPTGQTVKWANAFDPTQLQANAEYEIRVINGHLATATYWD